MTVPSVIDFEAAATAVNSSSTTGPGLTPLMSSGSQVSLSSANGAVGRAYVTSGSSIIVAYQGTETETQLLADLEMSANENADALLDAVNFIPTVSLAAAINGLGTDLIYVTGYSLGGTLAEYVAMKTGMPGMSFAGSGLPHYKAPAKPVTNFISWVETGDPWANRASDAALKSLAPGQAHYGTVHVIGSAQYNALTTKILSDTSALVPALFTGKEPQAVQQLIADYTSAFNTRHVDNPYFGDISSLPSTETTIT